MHLHRIQIKQFRNFEHLDVRLKPNSVIVGENRVGKSNFIFALRLVLDASLPDTARQLKLTDFWDGRDVSAAPCVEVHLDFADFDSDERLAALLTDYRLAADHTIARLSYVCRKRADVQGLPASEADLEFKLYGREDETAELAPRVRRRISLALLPALRDAEAELGVWRTSPLRSLLDDAISSVPKTEMDAVGAEVNLATAKIAEMGPIQSLDHALNSRMAGLAGPAQDIQTKLGLAPTDPLRLFRSIRLLIDGGRRGIADASLGSANLALFTLKLEEVEWLRRKNANNFTLVCIEEPEAHLHPHLQRTVFRQLLTESTGPSLNLCMTTHSPTVASVAPLSSIVLLKQEAGTGSRGYSLADLQLSSAESEDIQRYLDVSRADLLFSRGVIFVEGDAEEALVPVFARSLGHDLDRAGISVCNVGGTHFAPYIRFAQALALPWCVITDWDPTTGGAPLGQARCLNLIDLVNESAGLQPLLPAERSRLTANDNELRAKAEESGIFTNSSTLEVEVATSPALGPRLLDVLDAEGFGAKRQRRLAAWRANSATIDGEQLLAMVADIGKGRLAARLAAKTIDLAPPPYVASAIDSLFSHE